MNSCSLMNCNRTKTSADAPASIESRMTADLLTDVLTMAWFRRKPGARLRHHSDRGRQYASHAMRFLQDWINIRHERKVAA